MNPFRYLFVAGSVAALLAFANAASAATLALPARGPIQVGKTFTIPVLVTTGTGESMNAVSGTVSFPTDELQVVSLSSSGIIDQWTQKPSFSNANGTVSFEGISYNPGYSGTNGTALTITFRAIAAGTSEISFASPTILANDGLGTDITSGAFGTNVAIVPAAQAAPVVAPVQQASPAVSTTADLLAKITSSTHPDQTIWYKSGHASFDWTNAQGVTQVRLGYDKDADGKPSVVYASPISHKEIDLNDGIWYFHVQEKDGSGWGPIASFRIQIDTVVPAPVIITYPNGTGTATSTIAIQFSTTDALSGIDHYDVAVDGKSTTVSAEEGSGIYALPSGDTGDHTLVVTAFDKAGNSSVGRGRFTMTGVGAVAPKGINWSELVINIADILALALIVIGAAAVVSYTGWYLYHHFHKFRRRTISREERMHVLVHQRFNELKAALESEITALKKVKSKRELTTEEERIMGRLSQLLTESEIILDKEIDAALKK